RRRHTRSKRDWSSDVCSSDLDVLQSNVELPWRSHSRTARKLLSEILSAVELFLVDVRPGPPATCVGVGLDRGADSRPRWRGVVRSEERRVGKEWRSRGVWGVW